MQTAQSGAEPGAGTGTPVPGTTTDTGGAPPASPRLGIGNGRTNGNGAGAAPAATGTTADDLDDIDAGEGGAPAWGDNWRDGLAKGDAARLKRLERYATPDAVADALFAAQDRIRRGGQAPVLPEDATEDEVKAFRKAHGIPEAAKDYGLAWPDGTTPSEADNTALASFAEWMHARHIPPAAVKAAFEYYTAGQAAAQAERAEQAHELNQQNVAELREEYPGREFKRNMTIAEEFLAQHYEGNEEALDLVLQATLPNGVQVKNYAPFIRGLVSMARSYADDEALVGGDGAGGGKTLQQEYNELVAIPKPTQAQQDRALEVSEALQARAEKQGRRRQAA